VCQQNPAAFAYEVFAHFRGDRDVNAVHAAIAHAAPDGEAENFPAASPGDTRARRWHAWCSFRDRTLRRFRP
jgi:hypothetical protein